MSIYDTYRVVTTDQDGKDSPGNLWDRDIAMAIFSATLLKAGPKPARLRVISEQTWLAAKAAGR